MSQVYYGYMDDWPTGRQYRAAARCYREEAKAAPTQEIREMLELLAAEYEEIAELLDIERTHRRQAAPYSRFGTA